MATSSVDPQEVLHKAFGLTGGLPSAPEQLPPAEALQKLQPLMTSLKHACGDNQLWAPAIHQMLHVMLTAMSAHTNPGTKLFCPCCTQHKNRDLFGRYYNTKTLVCKRCSTKFRELVNSRKLHPETSAFHARLAAVMDAAAVGTRKRKSRKLQSARPAKTVRRTGPSTITFQEEAATAAMHAAVGTDALGSVPPCKVESDGESAVSSGSKSDASSVVLGGLWADVPSSGSSDSGDSGISDTVPSFYDIFDTDLDFIATDLPLFGAAPGEEVTGTSPAPAPAGTKEAVPAVEGDEEFHCTIATVPTLSGYGAGGQSISQDQLESILSVASVSVVPVGDGQATALSRSEVNTCVPSGEYKVRVELSGEVGTEAMVCAMLVELPTEFRSPESWTEQGPVPQRMQFDALAGAPKCFQDTLKEVMLEGEDMRLDSCNTFHLHSDRKFAIVAMVTSVDAKSFTSFADIKRSNVAMLHAGGFFNVAADDC